MSCSAYKPSSATENLARQAMGCGTTACPNAAFGNATYAGGMRTYPYECGHSVFVPKQPGPGFAGTPFEDTQVWIKQHLEAVKSATALEVRNGYPRSSYVLLKDAAPPLPPQFCLCNQ